MQYALQGRHDDGAIKIAPGAVQTVVTFLAASASPSLLDRDEDAWRQAWFQRFPGRASPGHGDSGRALLVYARRTVEALHAGRGWDVEYPRDAWRLRNLGVSEGPATVRFTQISQPWLKELAKRWTPVAAEQRDRRRVSHQGSPRDHPFQRVPRFPLR